MKKTSYEVNVQNKIQTQKQINRANKIQTHHTMNYISDEELTKLIAEVEDRDLVKAPPGVKDYVLKKLDEDCENDKKAESGENREASKKAELYESRDADKKSEHIKNFQISKKDKFSEYKRFRNRVIVSVAAILVITTVAPVLSEILEENVNSISVSSITDSSTLVKEMPTISYEDAKLSKNSEEDEQHTITKIQLNRNADSRRDAVDSDENESGALSGDTFSKLGNSYYITDLLNRY